MKIAVVGLWHLGTVTAACLADAGHMVVAYDRNKKTISQLQQCCSLVNEPGLDDLLTKGVDAGTLKFSSDPQEIKEAEIVWVTYDTPVDEEDRADTDFVFNEVVNVFSYISQDALLLISSQLPVGSTRKLQRTYVLQYPSKKISFAYSPENLRLGKAIAVFTKPDRVVIGIDSIDDKNKLLQIFKLFTDNIVWMSIESAEMTKHALNAFLATSVVFANELATLCECAGADASEVEKGLKSEVRIGPRAYLRAGNAFAGGTLARDLQYLTQIGQHNGVPTQLFSAVIDSNNKHKQWSQCKIKTVMGDLKNKQITILGLTYKPDTDTLRRSSAVETCQWLKQQGASVVAYDPKIKSLPPELSEFIRLEKNIHEALNGSDAAVISTELPEFMNLTSKQFIVSMKQSMIFDAGGFLYEKLENQPELKYFSVGRKNEIKKS